jgi:DNA polymerase
MSRAAPPPTISAADFLPARHTLPQLRAAAQHCEGCELFRRATQAVFGAGTKSARLMIVGETPGDAEDKAGKPFVGPAGKLLDQLFDEADLAQDEIYITNAVKHFKWTPGPAGRRWHSKPTGREISACRPWLEAEIEAVQPELIVCLGATAAQTLLGRAFRITAQRGEVLETHWAPRGILATYHPAAVLRAPHSEDRRRMRAEMLSDLQHAQSVLNSPR